MENDADVDEPGCNTPPFLNRAYCVLTGMRTHNMPGERWSHGGAGPRETTHGVTGYIYIYIPI